MLTDTRSSPAEYEHLSDTSLYTLEIAAARFAPLQKLRLFRHDFHSGAKAIRHSVNVALHYNCITFGGSLCTTRSTSGISSPLAATSVATKQRTFPSRKLCRVNKI